MGNFIGGNNKQESSPVLSKQETSQHTLSASHQVKMNIFSAEISPDQMKVNISRTTLPDKSISNIQYTDSHEIQKQEVHTDTDHNIKHKHQDSNSVEIHGQNKYYLRPTIYLQYEIDAKITFHQRLLIFGYVRDIEREFDDTLSYTIPMSIVYLFAAYYCVFRDEWNRRYCGESVMFVGHKIIKKISQDRSWTICAFGYQVNDKVCDALNIEFTWRFVYEFAGEFNIGYIKINDNIEDINYNGFELGDEKCEQNQINSVKIPIGDGIGRTDYENDDWLFHYLVTFNFVTEEIYLSANNKLVDTRPFKCKSILPAIAVLNRGDMVEISKYELIQNWTESW